MQPQHPFKVTLISPARTATYSGLLPAVVAGHESPLDLEIDLGRLCQFAGADLVVASATGVDPIAQHVELGERPTLLYDRLSIDVGLQSALSELSALDENLLRVKPISHFMTQYSKWLETYQGGGRFAIVGGGAAGVELAFAIQHRFAKQAALHQQSPPQLVLCQGGQKLLPHAPRGLQKRLMRRLTQAGIEVYLDFLVTRQGDGQLVSEQGLTLAADRVLWVTGGAPHDFLADSGLTLTEQGYLAVNEFLQSPNYPEVFAVGDAAESLIQPRPKAGVYPVRQAAVLHHNLVASVQDRPLKPFRAQKDYLSLISMGSTRAIGYRGGFWLEGDWLWRLKQRIDRNFLGRYRDLPVMQGSGSTEQELIDPNMQCRGCGAKVSGALLRDLLAQLKASPGSPMDDAAVIQPPPNHLMVQSVDSFRPIIEDPYLLARIAVVHAASDIVAMGGRLGPVMLDVTMPYASPSVTKALLHQVMAGALAQIKEEGGELVGGHTSEGLELNISVSVTGWVTEELIKRPRNASKGDRLILSQPLGTGLLFANAMRGAAKAPWVQAGIDSMLVSNRGAAAILTQPSVNAVTDVTGFGLLGHLENILADDQGACIELAALPTLPGVDQLLVEDAVLSTADPKNRQMVMRQVIDADSPWAIRRPLLFDPQTAGGLLLSVTAHAADDLVEQLREAGFSHAGIIGAVTEFGGQVEV